MSWTNNKFAHEHQLNKLTLIRDLTKILVCTITFFDKSLVGASVLRETVQFLLRNILSLYRFYFVVPNSHFSSFVFAVIVPY